MFIGSILHEKNISFLKKSVRMLFPDAFWYYRSTYFSIFSMALRFSRDWRATTSA